MLYFMFALATFVTPFILGLFNNHHYVMSPSNMPVSDSEYLFVIGEKPSSAPSDDKFLFVIHEEDESVFQKANGEQIKEIKEELEYVQTRSEWMAEQAELKEDSAAHTGPVISKSEQFIPFSFIMTTIPIFYLGFSFLFMAFYTSIFMRTKQLSFDHAEVMKLDVEYDDELKYSNKNKSSYLLAFLLFIFYFIYSTSFMTYGSYVNMFAEELSVSIQHSQYIMQLLWASMALGSFLAIPLTLCVRPNLLLGSSIALMLASTISLMLVAFAPALLWPISVSVGLSSSVMFAAGISWTYQQIHVSGMVAFVFVSSSMAAQLFVPTIIPLCLSSFGNLMFTYILLVAALAMLFIFIALILVASRYRKLRQDAFEDTQQYEEDF